MFIEEKLNFTEEQRGLVASIITARPMSRVACIRYVLKIASVPSENEDDTDELKNIANRTVRMLCRMTDEEYAGFAAEINEEEDR